MRNKAQIGVDMYNNIAVIGSSGAIGSAFIKILSKIYPNSIIHAFSRKKYAADNSNVRSYVIDYSQEESIEHAANVASESMPLDLIIVATGILHDDSMMPEKSLKELSAEKFHHLFEVNTVIPALIAKYFLPKINRNRRSVFAVLSARVGSISDNRLGGWYAYRASKAALNMVIKNAAIEVTRTNDKAIIVGLHPGTVDSDLSRPFQGSVPEGKLFSPEDSAERLINAIGSLSSNQSGKCFAWDGNEVMP